MTVSPAASATAAVQNYATARPATPPQQPPKTDSDGDHDNSAAAAPPAAGALGKSVNLTA